MANKPHRCPICGGNGRVVSGFYSLTGNKAYNTNSNTSEECRSCKGTGVLWEKEVENKVVNNG